MITVRFQQILTILGNNSKTPIRNLHNNRIYFSGSAYGVKNTTTKLFINASPTTVLNSSNDHLHRKVEASTKLHACNFTESRIKSNNGMFTGQKLFNSNQPITSGIRCFSTTLPRHEGFTIDPAYNESYIKFVTMSPPVQCMKDFLVYMHDITGLPWWATIVSSTILLRTLTVPLFIYQHYNAAKALNVSAGMKDVVDKLKKDANYAQFALKQNPKIAQLKFRLAVKREWKKRVIEANCHPAKGFVLFIIQLPLWLCTTVAIRNLTFMLSMPTESAQKIFEELAKGGTAWFPNLIQPDQFYIMPIVLTIMHLTLIEVQQASAENTLTKSVKYVIYFQRVLALFGAFITSFMPASISIYWVTSSGCGLFLQLLILSPTVRRLVGIPKTKHDLQDPYTHIRNTLKKKFTVKSPVAEPAVKLKRKHVFYNEINYPPLY